MSIPSTDTWDAFSAEAHRFKTSIQLSRAVNVNTSSLRGEARELVQSYFRMARPELIGVGFIDEQLTEFDEAMQELLRLSGGNNAKKTYVRLFRRIKKSIGQTEADREVILSRSIETSFHGALPAVDATEARILELLTELVPTAALSYQQAIRDLCSDDGRVSYRGTANELREALRETLDHLAPDADVMAATGFKLEPGLQQPSQKQKVRHILKSRGLTKNAIKSPETAVELADELIATLARASSQRSSISAHVASSMQEVQKVKMYVDVVLAELLEIHR